MVIKDDDSGQGRHIRVTTSTSLQVAELCRAHPNAVIQRPIRDHLLFRVAENANGARIRLTTCLRPGGTPEVHATFIAFLTSNEPYSRARANLVLGTDVPSGRFGARFVVAQPLHPDPEHAIADHLHGALIPNFDCAVELVNALHNSAPHLGVIGWDVLLDEAAEPWLIEWNTGMPGVQATEILTGPNFLALGWHALRCSTTLDG